MDAHILRPPPLLRLTASSPVRRRQEFGLRPRRRVVAAATTSASGEESPASITLVYKPMPPNRELRTPHSRYFKVSIYECQQSFCFMYSAQSPAFPNGMSLLDRTMHGPWFTQVRAQILIADNKYICQFTEGSKNFWVILIAIIALEVGGGPWYSTLKGTMPLQSY